jgi:hypothetical protein
MNFKDMGGGPLVFYRPPKTFDENIIQSPAF